MPSAIGLAVICHGQTNSGVPCRNKAVAGYTFCRHHLPDNGTAALSVLHLAIDTPVIAQSEIDAAVRALCQVQGWELTTDDGTWGEDGETASYRVDRQYQIRLQSFTPAQKIRIRTALRQVKTTADPLIGIQLAYAVIGWLLEETDGVGLLDIDAVIGLLGLSCRSAAEKLHWRKTLVAWVNILTSLRVIGHRQNTVGLQQPYDSLPFIIDEGRFDITGHSGLPRLIKLRASDWLRHNRGVFTGLGNIQAILALPGGHKTGRLAKVIALAMLVTWRLQAQQIRLQVDGTLVPISTTRKAILSRYLPASELAEILQAQNASRYRKYFSDALRLLVERGILGGYSEPRSNYPKRDWHRFWLNEEITLLPAAADATVIAEKARRNSTHRQLSQRPHGTKPKRDDVPTRASLRRDRLHSVRSKL